MARLLDVRGLIVEFGNLFRVGPASFAMDRGVLHVEGPNGSGKTTLIRALCGELIPSAGSVLVCGRDVHRDVLARRLIALVPSIPELPGFLSVREAYQFTAALRGAPDWNGEVYCAAIGLDAELPLASASAGQRRKAELICGLAADPPVLLFDETFTHLDTDGAAQLEGWIEEWKPSRLILLTHHGELPVQADAVLRVMREAISYESSREASLAPP